MVLKGALEKVLVNANIRGLEEGDEFVACSLSQVSFAPCINNSLHRRQVTESPLFAFFFKTHFRLQFEVTKAIFHTIANDEANEE